MPLLERYTRQVRLILSVLPEIAREDVFALKGGTAINLFYRDMPRLSVDIDLTYLPTDDHVTALRDIRTTLDRTLRQLPTAMRTYEYSPWQAAVAMKRES